MAEKLIKQGTKDGKGYEIYKNDTGETIAIYDEKEYLLIADSVSEFEDYAERALRDHYNQAFEPIDFFEPGVYEPSEKVIKYLTNSIIKDFELDFERYRDYKDIILEDEYEILVENMPAFFVYLDAGLEIENNPETDEDKQVVKILKKVYDYFYKKISTELKKDFSNKILEYYSPHEAITLLKDIDKYLDPIEKMVDSIMSLSTDELFDYISDDNLRIDNMFFIR